LLEVVFWAVFTLPDLTITGEYYNSKNKQISREAKIYFYVIKFILKYQLIFISEAGAV